MQSSARSAVRRYQWEPKRRHSGASFGAFVRCDGDGLGEERGSDPVAPEPSLCARRAEISGVCKKAQMNPSACLWLAFMSGML
jgi:hypothetical protein